MKNGLLTIVLIVITGTVKSQTTRYFEFRQPLDSTFTSFIAATSDTAVINDVLHELSQPIDQRKFISGKVTKGDGGFNYDGANWHTWHFVTNEWQLTRFNVEHCDGISSLIGNHPSVINGDTIYFCPWNSYPYQEVRNPGLSLKKLSPHTHLIIYPNPASNEVHFLWKGPSDTLSINVYNTLGALLWTTTLSRQQNTLDISNLSNGLYFVYFSDGSTFGMEKLMLER